MEGMDGESPEKDDAAAEDKDGPASVVAGDMDADMDGEMDMDMDGDAPVVGMDGEEPEDDGAAQESDHANQAHISDPSKFHTFFHYRHFLCFNRRI